MKLPFKVLNPKSDKDQIGLLRRFMGTGFAQVPPPVVARILVEKAEKNMKQKVKKALKRGETVTVDDLTAELKTRPDFMKLCGEIGLDMKFFEGLAEKAIKETG